MSWLVRSIAHTLTSNDEDVNAISPNLNHMGSENSDPKPANEHEGDPSSPTSPSQGVKEDISELTKTLTRQFWGVASFLAPPPQAEAHKPIQEFDQNNPDEKEKIDSSSDSEGSDLKIAGIRTDFAEIGGRFRSGISKLSSNVHVSEFTKLATNFLQLVPDDENLEELRQGNDSVMGAVGVTEEVVSFARDISMHPETWLDFPLPGNDDEDEFDLSDAQQEHALAVERLAPRLAALRIELCPGYMNESCFWMIYFVLLHPRLSKQDADLLSTPQIVKVRAFLSQELKSRRKLQDFYGEGTADPKDSNIIENEELLSVPSKTEFKNVPVTRVESSATLEMEKYPVTSNEIPIVDKSVIKENTICPTKEGNVHSDSSNLLVDKDEDDGDDWLKEESSEYGGATLTIENEEDVSFSDLEEEDDGDATATKKISYSSDKDTRDWVQLSKGSADSSKMLVTPNNPETKETNDWLDVDDIDVS